MGAALTRSLTHYSKLISEEPMPTETEILTALKDCYDPEIPVNIVDLGLIYGVHFAAAEGDLWFPLLDAGTVVRVAPPD
jgi:hypothetical protein